MLRVLIVFVVIIVAMLRGGSLGRLARLPVRWIPLVLLSLLLQLLIFPLVGDSSPLASLTVPLYLGSMLLLVGWVWLNRHLPAIALIGAGVVMNLLAIAANGGYMPVAPAAAAYAGTLANYSDDPIFNNSHASASGVRLWLLTDIFPVPAGLPFATVYSLGDLLLTLGIAILCYTTMLDHTKAPLPRKGTQDEHTVPAT